MNKRHLSNETLICNVINSDQPEPTVADGVRSAWDGVGIEQERSVWIVDASAFQRECISRSVQAAFGAPVETFASLYDLDSRMSVSKPGVILLSIAEDALHETIRHLSTVAHITLPTPIIVLSTSEDPVVIRSALTRGAKGYIPASMPFDIALGVIRFVLAGGTYAPIDFFLAAQWSNASAGPQTSLSLSLTNRELSVLRTIQQGKSNKLIAYELNMRENTVKGHVRSIMKKLRAKNRTELAIRSQSAAN